jgi:hypothetical protein
MNENIRETKIKEMSLDWYRALLRTQLSCVAVFDGH